MNKSERVEVKSGGGVIVAIGDTHFPFVDVDKLINLLKLVKSLKPSVVVQVGDLYDMYTFSRFSGSVDYITPKKELEEGKLMAAEMWKDIRKTTNAKCFQLRGNHSHRIINNLMAKAPEYESMLSGPVDELTSFNGVCDMKSSRSELVVDDIVFIHGWSTRLGHHMNYFGQSVVCGHTHRGGIEFKAHKGKALFELNCGHIADVNQLPLQYGETKTTSWVAGLGVIDNHGPRFIPL